MTTTNGTETNMAETKAKGKAKTLSLIDIKLMLAKNESPEAILAAGASPAMLIQAMSEENAKLKEGRKSGNLAMKIGDKGTLSVYGLARFPISLYPEQWHKVFALKGDIETFLAENEAAFTKQQEWSKSAEGKAALEKKKVEAELKRAASTKK